MCYWLFLLFPISAAIFRYIGMAQTLKNRSDHISASVYTQTTDVELECDGFLNYDRSSKFAANDTAAIKAANLALTQPDN